jgi:hypothetical protein
MRNTSESRQIVSIIIIIIIIIWMLRGSSPYRGWEFSLHHGVPTGSGVHPASYSMGTRGSFPGGKAAGV